MKLMVHESAFRDLGNMVNYWRMVLVDFCRKNYLKRGARMLWQLRLIGVLSTNYFLMVQLRIALHLAVSTGLLFTWPAHRTKLLRWDLNSLESMRWLTFLLSILWNSCILPFCQRYVILRIRGKCNRKGARSFEAQNGIKRLTSPCFNQSTHRWFLFPLFLMIMLGSSFPILILNCSVDGLF